MCKETLSPSLRAVPPEVRSWLATLQNLRHALPSQQVNSIERCPSQQQEPVSLFDPSQDARMLRQT